MNEVLDEKKHLSSRYKITPLLIIGLIVLIISIVAIITAIFNELTSQGNKGTIGVLLIAPIVFVIALGVLYIERKIITEKNKWTIIIVEFIAILIILISMYS